MIDVGQGDSSLIEYHGFNILIDTGGASNYDLAKQTIIPYLKSRGIRSLNYLILSHGDADHMGGALNLVNNFKVDEVIFNCGDDNDLEQSLKATLNSHNIQYEACPKELVVDDTKWQFLNTGLYDNENDNSSVIYVNYDNTKFLFMGDASLEREQAIITQYELSDIDFLKVGHHGSRTSTSASFIDVIKPKYALISVGLYNKYHHPSDEVINRLEAASSQLYLTSLNGMIRYNLKTKQIETKKKP